MEYQAIKTDEVIRGIKLVKEAKASIKQRQLRIASQKLNEINDIFINAKEV